MSAREIARRMGKMEVRARAIYLNLLFLCLIIYGASTFIPRGGGKGMEDGWIGLLVERSKQIQ